MRGIEQRLERLEEVLGDNRCVCGDRAPARAAALLVVEEGWDEERIRAAETSKQVRCPLHGQWPTVIRISATDARL